MFFDIGSMKHFALIGNTCMFHFALKFTSSRYWLLLYTITYTTMLIEPIGECNKLTLLPPSLRTGCNFYKNTTWNREIENLAPGSFEDWQMQHHIMSVIHTTVHCM